MKSDDFYKKRIIEDIVDRDLFFLEFLPLQLENIFRKCYIHLITKLSDEHPEFKIKIPENATIKELDEIYDSFYLPYIGVPSYAHEGDIEISDDEKIKFLIERYEYE